MAEHAESGVGPIVRIDSFRLFPKRSGLPEAEAETISTEICGSYFVIPVVPAFNPISNLSQRIDVYPCQP